LQIAMRCLIDAAEHGGILMMAEIAMRRALSHGRPKPAPEPRQLAPAPRRKRAKVHRMTR